MIPKTKTKEVEQLVINHRMTMSQRLDLLWKMTDMFLDITGKVFSVEKEKNYPESWDIWHTKCVLGH